MAGETTDTTDEIDYLDPDTDIDDEIVSDDDDDSIIDDDDDNDDDDAIISDDDDDALVLTAEINVEKLVAKIDKQDGNEVERRKAVKRRLEEIEELKNSMKELDSTYNFNLDDEL